MKDSPNSRGKQTINAIASENQIGEIAQRGISQYKGMKKVGNEIRVRAEKRGMCNSGLSKVYRKEE